MKPMNPVEQYYRSLGEIHRSRGGVDETSYYPALETLLNEVGKTLKPKARCIINLANAGAGIPDGGIFSQDQLKRQSPSDKGLVQVPERGAIEVKPPRENPREVIASEQGQKYLARYGLVLVTNLREFVLFERGIADTTVEIESYTLAQEEHSFWDLVDYPKQTASKHAVLFPEFLRRVLTRKTRLSEPSDVAWFLASYARQAKTVIEWKELATLAPVRSALEEVLGLKFEGEKGDHFFKSTLVQTLFYGLFASWVMWSKKKSSQAAASRFEWRMAQWDLKIPMIGALFGQVANAQQLNEEDLRDLVEPLDRAADTLNRVDRDAFFARFAEAEAVQYFYEPFLQAFDPELRKSLGVWYTPPEIVRYMVERVDVVLRTELHIEDGLADPRVYVLDPCCGTGAFLVEVLRRIERTLKDKGGDALVAQDLKAAARDRVFGFEIMPAPFVISHLQLGLVLEALGAPLRESSNERVGVYLTNSLTGWEPAKKPKDVLFKELEAERDAAEDVKRNKPILVILGNPPYNAFAGVSPAEEDGLVEPYKEGLVKEWGIRKFNLDELYVRFFRLAERRVAEMTGSGVVCFISSASWVSQQSFVVMRQHLLESFDRFWIENLHGNRKISEYAPDGRTSETIFAIAGFSAGIQQGVATSIWVKHAKRRGAPIVHYRDDIDAARATERRQQLLDSLGEKPFDRKYEVTSPDSTNQYSFRPFSVSDAYQSWPKVVELSATDRITGYKENRGFSLIDDDRTALVVRMRKYFDSSVTWESLDALGTGLTKNAARFDARDARRKVCAAENYDEDRVRRYLLRPFDPKWCYYCPVRPLWNEPRPSLFVHQDASNGFLVTRPAGVAHPEGVPFYFTRQLADFDFLRGHSYHFPIRLAADDVVREAPLFVAESADRPHSRGNLSARAKAYLATLGQSHDSTDDGAQVLWMHVLAIGYSPVYLREHADGIRQDWPRVPLPAKLATLRASAELGGRIAALLETETLVKHVDTGALRSELKVIGVLTRVGGGAIDPDAGDLDVNVGWGHEGKKGVKMPGKGRLVRREYTKDERVAIEEGARKLELTTEQALDLLGAETLDVFLNGATYWRNVPTNVWEYVIGGYQVVKKWLSYREHDLLGRSLTIDEARYVTNMVRRISALALLQPALNGNYLACVADGHAWPAAKAPTP